MANVPVTTAGQWLQKSSLPFIVEDGTLKWIAGGVQAVDLPDDLPSHIQLSIQVPGGSLAELRLAGRTVGQIHVEHGRVAIVGKGTVTNLSIGSSGSVELTLAGHPTIESLDASAAAGLSIVTTSSVLIDTFTAGNSPIVLAGTEEFIAREISVGPNGRLALAGNPAYAVLLRGPESIELVGGTLQTHDLIPETIALRDEATLTVTGSVAHGLAVDLRMGTLQIHGKDALVEGLTLQGFRGAVSVREGVLVRPHFDPGMKHPCRLSIADGGEVLLAEGLVSLLMDRGFLVGNEQEGIRLVEATVTAESSIENIDLFSTTTALLASLEPASRLTPAWKTRGYALQRSLAWTGGLRSSEAVTRARAHYWGEVERLLGNKAARGSDAVVAHEIAQNTRRLAAKGAERAFLELSRCLGYTTRPFRPIVLWCALAALTATLLRWLHGGLCLCNPSSGFDLWVDVLLSPVTWVRQVGKEETLVTLIGTSSVSRLVAFAGRLVGTVALAATALSVRRYVRPAGGNS